MAHYSICFWRFLGRNATKRGGFLFVFSASKDHLQLLRTGAAHPLPNFSRWGCTRRTRSNGGPVLLDPEATLEEFRDAIAILDFREKQCTYHFWESPLNCRQICEDWKICYYGAPPIKLSHKKSINLLRIIIWIWISIAFHMPNYEIPQLWSQNWPCNWNSTYFEKLSLY